MTDRGWFWSLPNGHQDISDDMPMSFQPTPLGHNFRCGVEYGYPGCTSAGKTILDTIGVLHLSAYGRHPSDFFLDFSTPCPRRVASSS
jgi:hypothetical protein